MKSTTNKQGLGMSGTADIRQSQGGVSGGQTYSSMPLIVK